MSDGYNDVCVCGHAKDTHFFDRERPGEFKEGTEPKNFWGACLGLRCDDCSKYRPLNTYKGRS